MFESDTHRRVLAHVPLPGDPPQALHPLGARISPDRHHGLSHVDELEAVLGDLETSGYLCREDGCYCMTDAGLEALQAPAPEAPAGTEVKPAAIAGLDLSEALPTAPSPEPDDSPEEG